ncbi:hypothetical protein A3H65_03210 [Candidatus Giovannonibacteria bacterium RIFCSPLOWO2_02_FULL_45_14]|nr:MAG: hypothetical protein A3H65_03210 [Candidatus Giovannonibacteria bacterium RIFCSPLOWO2_02_FULL_45_14]
MYFSQGLLAASSTLGYLNVGYIDATSTTATSTFSGGLTVDGNTLVVDWFNNRLGIGTTSPSSLLSVHGNALIAGTTTVSGLIATSTAQIAKGLMIGTTTLASGLTLDGSVTSANGIAGIYEIANLNHASGAAFANRMIVGVNNSAAATSEGLFLRMLDNTSGFGNSQLVRAVEIQADRGSNTQGVNTGIISFGRTFGVQGVTSGTAAGFLVPAGVYAENQGTSTGSAFRAYSATSTTADLVSFFQELSAFTGTGLKMNFGKGTGGSFTGNFLDMQVNDASRFLITSGGTTTVGNGVMQAGLQIGRGGLCVDNDGSCEASTTGRISSVTSTLGASDVAENYFSDEALEPGDVVITKKGTTTSYAFVGKSSSPDEPLFGVVSTKPGITLGTNYENASGTTSGKVYPVALSGRIPVKISLENGNIKAGDTLTAASEAGYAMKARPSDRVIGLALEDYTGAAGESNMVTEEIKNITKESTPVISADDGLDYSGGLLQRPPDSDTEEILPGLVIESTPTPAYGSARIMMFVNVGTGSHLDITNYTYFMDRGTTTPFWAIDQQTGEIKTGHFTDFRDADIANVRSIISSSGNWSIDENGKLTADEVHAKKLCLEDVCITKDELQKLLDNANTASAPGGTTDTATTAATPPSDTSSTTPTTSTDTSAPVTSTTESDTTAAAPEPAPTPVDSPADLTVPAETTVIAPPASTSESEAPEPTLPIPSEQSSGTESSILDLTTESEDSGQIGTIPEPTPAPLPEPTPEQQL